MSLILDSTLRDGAYAFGNCMPMAYVNVIAENLDELVDYIEVGSSISFGYGSSTSLQDDIERLEAVNSILKSSTSAIFIQPHLWFSIGSPCISELSTRPGLIRIGIDPELPPSIEHELISECRELGIPFSINLMKVYKHTSETFTNVFKLCNQKADFVSIVDSSGCMTIEEVLNLIEDLSRKVRASFGLHIHNNIGHANQISLSGLSKGFCIDSTLMGHGRAGGNADTCLLVIKRALLRDMSLDSVDLIVEKLMAATSLIWGASAREHLINILFGVTSLHSSKLNSKILSSLQMIPSVKSMLSTAWQQ